MIFVATFGIGLAAGLTRSMISMVAACLAIIATFIIALTIGGGASIFALLAAIGGYNLGLIALIGVHYIADEPAVATEKA